MLNYDNIRQKENQLASSVAIQSQAGKSGIQLKDNRPGSIAQKRMAVAMAEKKPVQRKENKTGLPDNLKSGIENLSGISMDEVKVHYGSDKPAQINALAYARGKDIHVAPGQEKHLPHEAWHVVQQMQGRVRPTMQVKGNVSINDNKELEKEADRMGANAALQAYAGNEKLPEYKISDEVIQCWQGNSLQTLTALLQVVWNNVQAGLWNNWNGADIEDAIYELATRTGGVQFTNTPTQPQHQLQLGNRVNQTNNGQAVVFNDQDTWRFYEVQHRQSPYQGADIINRRVSLHVNPDNIYQAIDYLNQHLLDLNYVREYKVSRRPTSIEQRLDNIDIYFEDSRGLNTNNAAHIFAAINGILNFILPEHPASMTELHPGVGTGDEVGGGESFSGYRSYLISRVVEHHLDNSDVCANYNAFEQKVLNRFQLRSIDQNNPSRNI